VFLDSAWQGAANGSPRIPDRQETKFAHFLDDYSATPVTSLCIRPDALRRFTWFMNLLLRGTAE
jgi:hypothetical protein